METKICSKCNIEKTIDEFQKRPNSSSYYGTCKKCKNEYSKQYRKDKAKQISVQRKQHYQDNIDELRERGRKYYQEHKEERNEKHKE